VIKKGTGMAVIGLYIENLSIDVECKSILKKLKAAGFDKAQVPYTIDDAVVASHEFSYLLKHGAVKINDTDSSSWRSVLNNFAVPKHGPEVGKIGFKLNFDLL